MWECLKFLEYFFYFLVVNECLNPLQNDCNPNADCLDELVGFSCHCRPGYVDIGDGKRKGRKCVKRGLFKFWITKNFLLEQNSRKIFLFE